MKSPYRIAKRGYYNLTQIEKITEILDWQTKQLGHLTELVAQTQRRLDDITRGMQETENYLAQLIQLYGGVISKEVTRADGRERFFLDLPPATGALRIYQLGCKKLLDALVQICEQQGLTYWLQSGSILGAVRHHGFVPWDDDLDVAMMRGDIQKLRKALAGRTDFKLTLFYDYYCCSRQLRFRTTDAENPCFVDVYIYDYGADDSEEAWAKWHQRKDEVRRQIESELDAQDLEEWHRLGVVEDKTDLGQRLRQVFDRYLPTVARQRTEQDNCVVWQLDNFSVKWRRLFNYDFIFPLKQLEFEGGQYNVPNQYMAYLERQYGDIYTLPKDIVTHFAHINKSNLNVSAIERFLKS